MIDQHFDHRHYETTIYETLWIIAFTAAVIGGLIMALSSLAQHSPL